MDAFSFGDGLIRDDLLRKLASLRAVMLDEQRQKKNKGGIQVAMALEGEVGGSYKGVNCTIWKAGGCRKKLPGR